MIAYATRTYASKQYQTFLSLVLMHVPLILIKNLCVFKCHTALITKHFLTVRVDCGVVVAYISCGGQGDAADVLQVFLNSPPANLGRVILMAFNLYFFYGDQDYSLWLEKAGFNVERLELVPTDDASW